MPNISTGEDFLSQCTLEITAFARMEEGGLVRTSPQLSLCVGFHPAASTAKENMNACACMSPKLTNQPLNQPTMTAVPCIFSAPTFVRAFSRNPVPGIGPSRCRDTRKVYVRGLAADHCTPVLKAKESENGTTCGNIMR